MRGVLSRLQAARPGRAVVVVLVVATLALQAAGTAVALDRRADDRREREAAAALRQAEVDYQRFVREVAGKVYDHVQPVFQVDRYFAESKVGSYSLVDDVAKRGGAASAVAARGRELAAQTPPPSFAERGRALVTAVEELADSLVDLSKLPSLAAVSDQVGFDRFLSSSYLPVIGELRARRTAYSVAVAAVYDGPDYPPRPTQDGAVDGMVKPVSKGSYLYTVGDACVTMTQRLKRSAAGAPLAKVRAVQAGNRAVLRKGVGVLVGVKVPEKDRAVVGRTVVEPLQRFLQTTAAVEPLLAALEEGDQAEVERQLDVLRASEAQRRRVERGMRAYGSTVCAAAFGEAE